jgi:hypothetical protein
MDQHILQRHLDGLSIRRIAREFRMSDRAVNEALDRALPPLDAGLRQRLYRADLARLEELLGYWQAKALEGSATATGLVLKILERRASLTGIDAPINMRLQVIEQTSEQEPTSTEALLAEFNRIAEERPAKTLRLSTGAPCEAEPAAEAEELPVEPPPP